MVVPDLPFSAPDRTFISCLVQSPSLSHLSSSYSSVYSSALFCSFVVIRNFFPRLVAAEHHLPYDRAPVSSGVAELDALLGGGPERGSSLLLMGPAGCGKSAIACRYSVAAAGRGERVAVFAFDEGVTMYLARARSLGMDAEEHIEAGRLTVQQIDPAELSPGEFAHAVRAAVERDGARLVVIDSLNGYLNAMPSERHLTLHLHELLTYLGQQGVTTILLMAQHGLVGGNAQVPIDASYLADTVILMRYFEVVGEVRQAISVIKKRTGRHERTIREVRFESGRGIVIGEPIREFQGVLTGTPAFVGSGPGGPRSGDGPPQ